MASSRILTCEDVELDALIYEDTPYSSKEEDGSLTSLLFSLPVADIFRLLVLIFLGILGASRPQKYQIFDNKLRIVLRRPFKADIPFNKIETAIEGGIPDIWSLRSKNYISSFHENIVIIVKKKWMNIIITPSNPDTFIEKLNKALAEWRRSNKQ